MIEIDGFTFELNQTKEKHDKSLDQSNMKAAEKIEDNDNDADFVIIDNFYDEQKHDDFDNLEEIDHWNSSRPSNGQEEDEVSPKTGK